MGKEPSTPALQKFLDNFRTVDYEKGQIILFQGEVPRNAYIIKKGCVKVYNIDENGREQLIYFLSTNDVFPFTWIMGHVPTTQYFYETVTDSIIYQLPKERYLDFIQSSKVYLYECLEVVAQQEGMRAIRLSALLQPKASDKLVHTLNSLVLGYGFVQNNRAHINIPLTHQDFANMTGVTRETVSLEFTKLKKSGVITATRSLHYELNYKELKKLLKDQVIT
jgi:CRP/FNR family transcriptional regulator, cyclic AMP receptor protein